MQVFLRYGRDISATVQKLRAQYGPRVAVLPEGPYPAPYLAS